MTAQKPDQFGKKIECAAHANDGTPKKMPMKISKSGRFRKMSKKAEMAVCDHNMLFFANFDFNFIEEHKFLLRNLIDWAEDGHRYVDDQEDEEDEEPEDNIYPYKKCSVCSERKSCGNYDTNKIWFCEDCYEEPEEDEEKTAEIKCYWCNARGVDTFNGKAWIHKSCE